MLLGASKSVWAGVALPLDLGVIGMPGCTLFASGEIIHRLVRTADSARWTFVVPTLAGMLGQPFTNQAVVSDPGANAFGAVVSNAGEGIVGAK